MDPQPFITIRCPSCGSGDVRALEAGRFACGHCQSSFLYTGGPRLVRPDGPRPAASAATGGVLVVVVALTLLVFGGAVFFLFFAAGESSVGPSVARAPAVAVASSPTPIAVQPIPRPPTPAVAVPEPEHTPQVERAAPVEAGPLVISDYQQLHGCSCAGDNKGARLDLHARAVGKTTTISGDGIRITRELAFALAATGDEPWALATTAETAPAASYDTNGITIGVGCKGDTVVIAAGTVVSAWSRSKRALLWSQPLPGPYGAFGDRPGNDLGLDCKTLRPSKDAITLRAGNRSVKLALADGAKR